MENDSCDEIIHCPLQPGREEEEEVEGESVVQPHIITPHTITTSQLGRSCDYHVTIHVHVKMTIVQGHMTTHVTTMQDHVTNHVTTVQGHMTTIHLKQTFIMNSLTAV